MLALALVLSLAACGTTQAQDAPDPAVTALPTATDTPAPELPEAPAASPTAVPTLEPTASPDPANTATLTAILTEISESYYPGTAGCSLTAARMAGELLDWNAENRPQADAVAAETQAFFASLTADQAAAFPELLRGIYDAAGGLLAENAKDVLDTAGYAPKAFPWTPGDVIAVFDAVYQGIGMTRPVD